jgi:hypothetical protein
MTIYLKPGEKIPDNIKESLKMANLNLTTTGNHQSYINEISSIFFHIKKYFIFLYERNSHLEL